MDTLPKTVAEAIAGGEPIYEIPPIERQPELSIRADMLAESRDWGHAMLGIEALHARGILGEGVTVAICDTGIAVQHRDLAQRIVPAGNKDFTGSPAGFFDVQGHGTHCAGIVGSSADGEGLIGVAPKARLMALKCLNDQGSGASSWIAAAIRHAADNGADIISASLGGPMQDPQTRAAAQYAISKGCWFVAAAGNDSREANSYPGHYPELIAVAAVNRDGNRASFSTINPENDVAAPGVSIMSTLPNDRYGQMSGTSMATPYVAGCLALLRGELKRVGAKMPTQAELLKAIEVTAKDVQPAGRDAGTGWGLVNPAGLIALLVTTLPPVPPTPEPGYPHGPFDIAFGPFKLRIYANIAIPAITVTEP